jgi:uncharacterized protein (TIGR03083 family)
MAGKDIWPTIHAERQALLADVEGLSDEQWSTPSLCEGWTVQDVLGHMTATATMNQGAFLTRMAGSRFRFHEMSAKNVARETAGTPADTVSHFRAAQTSTTHPPGPVDTWLGETVVHSEDIRRPLGIAHSYPMDALVRVADFYKGSNLLLHGKTRVEGLSLKATDTGWSTGSGPEVTGPMLSLVLAIVGRRAALDDLSGAGVDTLAERT